jgi:hypothetical protein
MATNADRIIAFLIKNPRSYCDDCISKLAKVKNRVQVNQICNRLTPQQVTTQREGMCSHCGGMKITREVADLTSSSQERNPIGGEKVSSNAGTLARLDPSNFEERVKSYLKIRFDRSFQERALVVGPNKRHRFDAVSSDEKIVAECKSFTWTVSGNRPSAKLSTALESVFYLSRVHAEHKILAFQDDINPKGKSLVGVFVSEADGLLDDVEVISFRLLDADCEEWKTLRVPNEVWYERLLAGVPEPD